MFWVISLESVDGVARVPVEGSSCIIRGTAAEYAKVTVRM